MLAALCIFDGIVLSIMHGGRCPRKKITVVTFYVDGTDKPPP
jgi:hypothetical protein